MSDFAEDPFKDYRYEDPFNIEDPFADEGKSPFYSFKISNLYSPNASHITDYGIAATIVDISTHR